MTKSRILIVEDETIVARDISEQLEIMGFDPVGFCIRGEDVVDGALKNRPDLVLMDINLAGEMDGIEAAGLVRDQIGVPVVFLTAFAATETFQRAIDADPFGYIVKPFTQRELKTVIDIALFKHRSEVEARNASRLLQSILETAQDGYALTDNQGRILDVNLASVKMSGYTRDELLGMSLSDLNADGAAADLAGTLKRISQLTSLLLERRLLRKDGSVLEVEISAQFLPIEGGQFVYFTRDVSERKAAAKLLQQSEARYRLLFDHNPLPMWLFDNETLNFVAVNDAAVEQYGYSRAEFLELKMTELHPAEDVERLLTKVKENRENTPLENEWRHRRKDGTVLSVEVIARDLSFQGRSTRLVMAADISEKKQLQEQFFRAQRLESLGLLASGIAHDLNNMLAPVLFTAPLLRPNVTSERDHSILNLLERSAERGTSLVRQILAFVHGASKEARTTQVKHLARDVVGVLEATLPRNIKLTTEISTDAWPVEVNPTQVHQVLLNLGVNARDAMPEGGELKFAVYNRTLDEVAAERITGGRSGNWLVLEVSDTGTGIKPEVLEHMWDSFYTTKGDGRGSGLGLSTVRSIIDLHQGFVHVETALGHGTTFRIYLPVSQAEQPDEDSDHPFNVESGRSELILVVDDDAMIREITKAVLNDQGYRVIEGEDGIEGIVNYNAHASEVALIITDVDMPNMNGAVLMETLRKLNPSVKVIGMSGLAGARVESDALKQVRENANAFLSKPFSAQTLLKTVHQVLEMEVIASGQSSD